MASILYGLSADQLTFGCRARMGSEEVQNLKHKLTAGVVLQRVNVILTHHLA